MPGSVAVKVVEVAALAPAREQAQVMVKAVKEEAAAEAVTEVAP